MISEELAETISKLWRDKSFFGAFSGLRSFQTALKLEKGIIISLKELHHLMLHNEKSIDYIRQIRTVNKYPRRPYSLVHGFFSLVQGYKGPF